MKDGFKVMDSDMHIVEPPDLWQRYIDRTYLDRAPVGRNEFLFDYLTTMDGRALSGAGSGNQNVLMVEGAEREREEKAPQYVDGMAHDWDAASQLRAMDVEGIDVAVLFPTRALFTHAVDGMDPGLSVAVGKAYNDWMRDFCREAPGRMFGAAHITPHDIEGAVVEVRRCVEEFGFKAIFMRPMIVNGRNWYDPYYDPLWAECERLRVPVCFHDASRSRFMDPAAHIGTHFDTTMLQHVCWHAMHGMLAAMAFCGGGILERYPNLKVAFLEGNCSWVPWLMWRLDEHQEWKGYEAPGLKLRPSEYFKRQCFVSVECDESPAWYVDGEGYGDTVVLSTDYPHPDSKYPYALDNFMKLELPDNVRRKYLWDNCARLYGL